MMTEINVYGVYVSPYAAMLLAAWASTFILRMVLSRYGLLAHAYNPALLMFAVFAATFSFLVLLATSIA